MRLGHRKEDQDKGGWDTLSELTPELSA